MFSHERLKVYDKALVCVANLGQHAAWWDKRHAVVEQLQRASESIVLNIAEANGRYPLADRRRFHEVAEASAVKAAAHLDLCGRKAELDPWPRGIGVRRLSRIALMLRGLSRG